jgi:hypothetical protein
MIDIWRSLGRLLTAMIEIADWCFAIDLLGL